MLPTLLLLLSACGPTCDEIPGLATDLVAEHQVCDAGEACVVVDLYDVVGANTCTGAFQCANAFPADADLEALGARARELEDDYARCGQCAMAGCIDPSTLTAACVDGVCQVR